ncbi:MAG TPA: metallophosphoesterase [Woeseiaceae bacterium]
MTGCLRLPNLISRHGRAVSEFKPIHKSSDAVRVLQVTDPHLFAQPDGSLRGTNTRLTLQAVLDHITEAAWPADLVALTGDLIQDDTRGAYVRVRDMLALFDIPVHCVPGNHDVRSLMQDVLRPARFHYCEAAIFQDWLVVGLDSCIEGQARGKVAKGELARLSALLAATKARHVLVCLHHPPLPVGSRWLDSVGLNNGVELLDLLAASGKVRAAIFGHVHQAYSGEYAGMRIIGTPSTCRQFSVNSDDFSLDDNPPAYRRLELHADGTVDSKLIWVEY